MLDPEELPAVELAREAVPEELDEADPETTTTVVLAEVEKAVSVWSEVATIRERLEDELVEVDEVVGVVVVVVVVVELEDTTEEDS